MPRSRGTFVFVLLACLVISLVCVVYPIYVIRPFRAPFADDTSTSRDIAFTKIRASVEGTKLAAEKLSR